ncbi:pilus assembly protein PilP [Azoarcus taiwanensis]|uniref:Pilus assembly protein PilP n=1 Tax=Azoarcus taiwanensis TaxID=666964 RepID=A0A972FCZ5_9RHOO|nr:pilus assembly protein PilP [Azoarcus taiwanensis]NMG03123.1 pilus assembly protein PilP [Azoarcus taiwanensis]
MKRLVILSCSLLLVACTAEQEDLRTWMASQERGMVGRVDPLPEIKPFPVVAYDAADDLDPFATSRVEPAMQETAVTGGPDMDRRREPLEAYPLESLNMVGVLMRDDLTQALINVGGVLHQVRTGNYMGQDHGMITSITEGDVTLVELVQDLEGNWVERTSQLRLQER